MTAVVQAIDGKADTGWEIEVLLQQLRIERLGEAIHAQTVAVELDLSPAAGVLPWAFRKSITGCRWAVSEPGTPAAMATLAGNWGSGEGKGILSR